MLVDSLRLAMDTKDKETAERVVLARSLFRRGAVNDALSVLLVAISQRLAAPQISNALVFEAIHIATNDRHVPNIAVLEEVLRRCLPQLPYLTEAWHRLMTVLDKTEVVRDSLATQSGAGELRRIISVRDWTEAHGGEWREIGVPENVPVGHCNAAGRGEIAGAVRTVTPYLAGLSDVVVRSGSSVIYDRADAAITDLLTHPQYGQYADMCHDPSVLAQGRNHLLVQQSLPDAHLAEGIWMNGLGSNQFGHWFAEYLPKLLYYEAHPRFHDMPLIVDADMPQQHYDFLRAMTPNPLYMLPRDGSLAVGRLWVAPTTTFRPFDLFVGNPVPIRDRGTLVPSVLRGMRDRILAALPDRPDSPRRLYLSRRKSSWRRLLNEDELATRLQLFGFTPIYLEDMSFADQVAAFRHAECVIAPAGSGANNLIFAPTDAKMILIQGSHYNSDAMIGPFIEIGYHDWNILIGESLTNTQERQSNIRIDIDRVMQCVRNMRQMESM